MTLAEGTHWIEAHPWQSTAIGGALMLVILWWLGFFGRRQSSDSGASLAGAYYAAEANQAGVAGQLQAASLAATRDVQIAALEGHAAEAIAATNASAAMTINAQNITGALGLGQQGVDINAANVAGAVAINAANVGGAVAINAATQESATAINAATVAGQVALGQYSLLATEHNADLAFAAVQSNNATAIQLDAQDNQAALFQTIYGKLIPYELALTGGKHTVDVSGPGIGGTIKAGPKFGPLTPKKAKAAGYTSAQFTAITGLPGYGGSTAGLVKKTTPKKAATTPKAAPKRLTIVGGSPGGTVTLGRR